MYVVIGVLSLIVLVLCSVLIIVVISDLFIENSRWWVWGFRLLRYCLVISVL